MRDYQIIQHGPSRSFSEGDRFLQEASETADVVVHIGGGFEEDPRQAAVLVELDAECLGLHTGEQSGREGSNALGFARYRNGNDAPTNLIELVRQPMTSPEATEAATLMFEAAGFEVVLCADQPGRIIDRLVRPKYNDALRFLDEGLATAEDMDMTCRLGLGYPDGLIERVTRGDLARHFEISKAIFEVTGHPAYVPARRAFIARERRNAT